MDFIVIIPARLASTRLPDKPLLDIAGAPMVIRTAQQAMRSAAKQVVIATDSNQIAEAASQHGFKAVLTSSEHNSGTDRIAEAANTLKLNTNQIIVNVQGDEPLIDPEVINKVAHKLHKSADCVMATCAHKISNAADFFNPNVVKVVCAHNGTALYFSRAPIPWARDSFTANTNTLPNNLPALHHIGLYAYRNSFLQQYHKLEPGNLEQFESLEQLRALENGFSIAVELITTPLEAGVDTPEDLNRVRNIWLNRL